MVNYQGGRIYTIRCKIDDTLIYVGSTTQPLAKRWAEHRSKSKKDNTRKLYQSINNNWGEWYIELYEEYPCDNREQLNKREGEIIRLIGNLNVKIEGRTKKEYYKEYHQNHREELLEAKRQYRINNKEYTKEYGKKYREEHKEELLAKNRARNKEHYNMKQRENYAKRQAKKKEIEALNPA